MVPRAAETDLVASDATILDLLRKRDVLTVSALAALLDVTATAVRQRLTRLMAKGYVERSTRKAGRGRPTHGYRLTTLGRRKTGANFADLALALWQEVRAVADPDVRRGLLQRISGRLAQMYASRVEGDSLEQRMESVSDMFGQQRIPFTVQKSGELPVLTALACPYPELAEQDRSVCAMERLMLMEVLGNNLKLNECRLDGASCCTFVPSQGAAG